eukprot:2770327-Amphidinium_carterae.1
MYSSTTSLSRFSLACPLKFILSWSASAACSASTKMAGGVVEPASAGHPQLGWPRVGGDSDPSLC